MTVGSQTPELDWGGFFAPHPYKLGSKDNTPDKLGLNDITEMQMFFKYSYTNTMTDIHSKTDKRLNNNVISSNFTKFRYDRHAQKVYLFWLRKSIKMFESSVYFCESSTTSNLLTVEQTGVKK